MKKLLISAVLSCAFALPAISFAEAKLAGEAQQATDYLFVQMAQQGTLNAVDGQPGTYQLKLSNIGQYVRYFSNRPARITGMMPIEQFLTTWQQNFTQNSPNVGVFGLDNKKPVNAVMELSDPSYDAKSNTITYTAHALKGDTSFPTQIKMDEAAVVIDSVLFCSSCVGSGF